VQGLSHALQGWTGGAYGQGSRINLSYTRSIIDAINSGTLQGETFVKMPRFGFDIPLHCPAVPDGILQPWTTWSDRAAYDSQLLRLTEMFNVNFSQFEDKCTEAVK
jgi:phosphoenolpyruvate carboxykinase (ATP)